MSKKIKKIIKNVLYALFSNVIYSFILYYTYTWLAGYSLIYAYLGNLALIIIALVIDELILKSIQSEIQSKKIVTQIDKDVSLLFMDVFISFKTVLYMVYIFILILSPIIVFNPTLLNEGLRNFIAANEYSILILIAVDMLIQTFSKDSKRIKKISTELKKYLNENQNKEQ